MKRIIVGGLLGWAGIVALGWWLAQRRIELCRYDSAACTLRATAARDGVLTGGLTVALLGLLLVVIVMAVLRRPRADMAADGWQRADDAMMRRKGLLAGRWRAKLPQMWRTARQGVSGRAYRGGAIIAALAFAAGTLCGYAGLSYANSVAQQHRPAAPWELDPVLEADAADCAVADVQSGDAATAQ